MRETYQDVKESFLTLILTIYYSISFYDRLGTITGDTASPFQIGLSLSDTTFGSLIYTAPYSDSCTWSLRTFSFAAPNNGQYITAKLKAGNANYTWCHLDNFSISSTTSISSTSNDFDIQLYPNPANGDFAIVLPTDYAEILVTNIVGQQILKTQTTQRTTNLQLDNNGVYIVYVKTKQGTSTRKLIVNR